MSDPFVTDDIERWGTFEPAAGATSIKEGPGVGAEDLLNLAAIRALGSGARARVLERAYRTTRISPPSSDTDCSAAGDGQWRLPERLPIGLLRGLAEELASPREIYTSCFTDSGSMFAGC